MAEGKETTELSSDSLQWAQSGREIETLRLPKEEPEMCVDVITEPLSERPTVSDPGSTFSLYTTLRVSLSTKAKCVCATENATCSPDRQTLIATTGHSVSSAPES